MKAAKAHNLLAAFVLAAPFSLAGCADDFAIPEKGVYQGAEDRPLDEETRERLRGRIRHQDYN